MSSVAEDSPLHATAVTQKTPRDEREREREERRQKRKARVSLSLLEVRKMC